MVHYQAKLSKASRLRQQAVIEAWSVLITGVVIQRREVSDGKSQASSPTKK